MTVGFGKGWYLGGNELQTSKNYFKIEDERNFQNFSIVL